jgi:adenine-specific DNA-methyltransferase
MGSNDFIYNDKHIDKTDMFRHSKWLSFMKCRLVTAKLLLHNAGCIYISINDNEQSQLKLLCDEIFGYDNFCGQIIWNKKSGGGQTDEFFVTEHEYILVYRKSSSFKWLDETIKSSMVGFKNKDEGGNFQPVRLAKWGTAARKEDRPTMSFPIKNPDGKNTYPIAPDGSDGRWRIGKKRMDILIKNKNIHWEKKDNKWVAFEKVYYSEGDVKTLKS